MNIREWIREHIPDRYWVAAAILFLFVIGPGISMLQEKTSEIKTLKSAENLKVKIRNEFGGGWYGLPLEMRRLATAIDDFVAGQFTIPPDEAGKTGLKHIVIGSIFDRAKRRYSEDFGGRIVLARRNIEVLGLTDKRLMSRTATRPKCVQDMLDVSDALEDLAPVVRERYAVKEETTD